MKEKNKKSDNRSARKASSGLIELLAAVGLIVLVVVVIFCTRSCTLFVDIPSVEDGVLDDKLPPKEDSPMSTVLNPVSADDAVYPIRVSESVTLDKIYTATGYFPEDGSDEEIVNVLAVKLTNTSEKTLEYLAFELTVNEEVYKFAVATLPAGKSVYAFNTEQKSAPEAVTTAECAVEYEIYFTSEPSKMAETFTYQIQNGTVVVKNISDKDIASDIVVYYKSTANGGYLGGITYRFRISGGLDAGKSYNAYAPHAYSHMTEIMFTSYEE